MKRITLSIIIASAAIFAPAFASDLNLEIHHAMASLGPDGISRKVDFGERLYRRENQVWVERIIPAGAHNESEHAKRDEEHKHLDLAASARWIVRNAKGELQIQMVNGYDKVIVNINPPDYGNIGFDGDWDAANHLIGSKQLASMKPSGQPAPAGCKWYESRNQGGWIKVLWDEKDQYPRQVESGNSSKTSHKSMTTKVIPAPNPLPWTNLQSYTQKEYSDTLD